jgi:putative aldouronate transport system permease protein
MLTILEVFMTYSVNGEIKQNKKINKKNEFVTHFLNNKSLYLMLIPGIAFYFIFYYLPMGGIVIAFKDFDIFSGIIGSEWVGFTHFKTLFSSDIFYRVFRNSLAISFYKLAVCFPVPILLAIMLNEIKHEIFKRSIQTIVYLPYFLSWVVIAGIVINLLSPSNGIINVIIKSTGGDPINFLASKTKFRTILVLSDLWHGMGWNTIIFLAALTKLDPQLYEAAKIDGAGRIRQIISITLPGIKSTIIVLLLVKIGNIMNNGFEQIFLLYNPNVYEVADVFETYVYRIGLVDARYDFATAVGLFKSCVAFVMLVTANTLARRFGERGIF